MKGIILFGHGARNPDWVEPFHRIREAIVRDSPRTRVELAFLELMTPTLAEAVDQLAAAGVTAIDIIPVFVAGGGHVTRDLPRMVATLLGTHPGLNIAIAAPVGAATAVIDAMARYALDPRP